LNLVEVDEIWLNFDSLAEKGSSSWIFAFCKIRDVLSVDSVDNASKLGSWVVSSVVHSVK